MPNTCHSQTAKFIATICQNLPHDLTDVMMQGWIEDPKGLQKALRCVLSPPEGHEPPYLIDSDTNPFTPTGWKVEEHQKGGQFTWDAAQVQLYLSEPQMRGGWIEGNKLREELRGKPLLNANVLDYLIVHPTLIPNDWKGKAVFFWGTIYRISGRSLCIRSLVWNGESWGWVSGRIVSRFSDSHPAALGAS